VNSPGCGSASRNVNVVITQPSVITAGNSGPVCQGSTLSLTANPVSGTTYTWSGPNGYSATGSTVHMLNTLPSDAGIYTLSVVQGSCPGSSYTTTVSVGTSLSNLNPGSNSPVCENGTLNLSAATRA